MRENISSDSLYSYSISNKTRSKQSKDFSSISRLVSSIIAMVAQTTGVVSALKSWRSYLFGPLHMSTVEWAGPVTRTNFALGSYEKFQPGF